MNISAQLQRLIEFLVDGKLTDTIQYQPEDVSSEMSSLETALKAGLSSKHLAADAVGSAQVADKSVTLAKLADMATASLFYRKTAAAGAPEVNSLATLKTDLSLSGTNSGDQTLYLLPFVGVDGSGVEPDLTCTLTGAPLNASVAAIIDTSNFSDARALFATTIAVAAQVEQVSLTDLSAKTFLALLSKE
jgi:hypothetical protein